MNADLSFPARCLLISLFLYSLSGCAPADAPAGGSRLGDAHLDVTGLPGALPHFDRGLLLLHSFEYADAREAFRQARETDPGLAMAYWGEAMTHHHPLWREQAYDEGRAVLAALAPTPAERQARGATGLERDLLRAVDILFGDGDKFARDKAYADFMGQLYEKYPGNHEVAAFYALSLLGSVPVGRDEEVYGRGAAIAKGILAENPDHPGALHYLIHSYDDPGHARLALEAAYSYAEVAPDAAHALHMPSHIYVAMGMWDEVVASNIRSWEASVNRMQRKGLDNDARSYHALHWLLYGYLQQDRHEQAAGLLRDMARYTTELPSRSARAYLINMTGNYLVETGDWTGELSGIGVDDRQDLNISTRAVHYFIAGMKAYRQDRPGALRAVIEQLAAEREKAALLVSDRGLPMCSAPGANRAAPNKLDLDQALVMELELRALEAMSRRDAAAAEASLRQAVALQDAISYDYGPPAIVLPAYELYGDWLLDRRRPDEALAQYQRALDRGPGRVRALRGKLQAAEAAGDARAAGEAREALRLIEEKTRAMDKALSSR